MVSGSGTNIKMLDYLSAGLPTISTAKGIRGLVDIEKYVIVCELNKFHEKILYLLKNFSVRNTLSQNGITFIEKHFLWKNSALKLDLVIKESLYENKK